MTKPVTGKRYAAAVKTASGRTTYLGSFDTQEEARTAATTRHREDFEKRMEIERQKQLSKARRDI